MNVKKRNIAVIATFFALFTAFVVLLTPLSVGAASDSMVITASSVTAMPGDEVQITVSLENNPGLASLKFDVAYDEVLTLTNVEFNTAFGAYVAAPTPYKNPQTFSFISPLVDVTDNGVFVTLTFVISEYAPDNYEAAIRILCDQENIFDGTYDPVPVSVVNGAVTVIHGIPGDIDGDRKVNNKDAIMLFRYVAGWDVDADEKALDVNCDGSVNNKDAITLFRYVAGWEGIEIGRGPASTVCTHKRTKTLAGYAATCTETGLTEGKACADCNAEIVAQQIIPAKGHTVVTVPAVEATCTTDGKTEGKHCSVCDEVLVVQKPVGALGHDFREAVTVPSCTTEGYTSYTCAVCGYSYVGDRVPPKGHIKGEPIVVTNDATCTTNGSVTTTINCSVCGKQLDHKVSTIPAKGHTEVIVPAVKATCTTDGKTEGKYCSVCNTVLVAQQVIPATGHTYVDGVCHCGDRDPAYVKTYTVIFVDYNGTVLSKQTVPEGSKAQAPSEPQREGYTFIGWDKSFDKVTADITVTAVYEEISTAPAFVVSNATAKAGDTVEVTVAVKNNPGIASIILSAAFDNDALTLTEVVYNTSIGGQTVQPQKKNSPIKLYWINGFADAEGDFVLATLKFTVKSDATAGDHNITLSYNADDVYDISETNLPFEIVNGKITVKQ